MKIVVLVALAHELAHDQAQVALPYPVVFTGVGKVNAALACAKAVGEHSPDLALNYGSAGGIHCAPAQLVEIASVVQRDADCEPLAPRGVMYEDVALIHSGHAGVRCGSGDSFVRAADDWTRTNCDVVDMELWGIAKACVALNVPWRAVKWISDAADSDAADHWQQNAARGADAFSKWLAAL